TNLGRDFDVCACVYDRGLLKSYQCSVKQLGTKPLCCALSVQHPLAKREKISLEDLDGSAVMLRRRGWSPSMDKLRNEIEQSLPEIRISDFSFFNMQAFNQCENTGSVLIAVDSWQNVHPLLKFIPGDWEYVMPFGLLYSSEPSPAVRQFLKYIQEAWNQKENRQPPVLL
ncbi:MAG: LysR substrate-binding domain-containing protein, partial [Bulleidia sp.]